MCSTQPRSGAPRSEFTKAIFAESQSLRWPTLHTQKGINWYLQEEIVSASQFVLLLLPCDLSRWCCTKGHTLPVKSLSSAFSVANRRGTAAYRTHRSAVAPPHRINSAARVAPALSIPYFIPEFPEARCRAYYSVASLNSRYKYHEEEYVSTLYGEAVSSGPRASSSSSSSSWLQVAPGLHARLACGGALAQFPPCDQPTQQLLNSSGCALRPLRP
eukprot:6207779-Pleurochrysis_carterae.AAC.3